MLFDISPEDGQTKQYLQHIYSDILNKTPLIKGELLEVQIDENTMPLPHIRELPSTLSKNASTANQKQLTGKVRTILLSNTHRTNTDQIRDKRGRQVSKASQLIGFTNSALDGIGTLEDSAINNLSPLNITLSYIVANPDAISKNTRRLGLGTLANRDDSTEQDFDRPQYSADPPYITWLGKRVAIPFDSTQHDICNIVFADGDIKTHSWDEIFEKSERAEPETPEKGRRKIYDAVAALNRKIREKTGKELFEWEEKSFRRIV